MPLQQISLDQSIYNKKSPVSQALTPKSMGATSMGAMPQGESMMERSQRLQEVEAERKYQEKMMKLQHEQAMEKAKFTAGMQEDAQKQQTTMGNAMAQAQQQGASRQKIEDNPAPAADEMWKFYQSLPEENKEQFMSQMSAPTSSGSTVSSGGKSVQVGGQKYNAIFQNWIDTKKVMSGPDGKIIVNEPEREFEKGTFKEMSDGGILNEATGDVIPAKDIPDDFKGVYKDVLKRGLDYVDKMFETSVMQEWSTEEMETFTVTKQREYKNWVAGQLVQEGMTDIDEIQKLSAMAVGNFDWKQYLTTGETNNDEDVVSGLRELFDENPEERDNVEEYRAKYGTEAVNKALGFNGLKGKQTPAKE